MTSRRAAIGLTIAVAGVIGTIILEAHVLEDWSLWALLSLMATVIALGVWVGWSNHPALDWMDRDIREIRKPYWERRLSELEELAEHLTAVRQRETLLRPRYVVALSKIAAELARRGSMHPRINPLGERERYEWEVYLWNLIDRVKRGKAKNLRPLYREVRKAIAEQQAAQEEFHRKLFGPR